MAYKRPTGKQSKITPLEKYWGKFGQLKTKNDPQWINTHLEEVHEDGALLLHFFDTQLNAMNNLDVSAFKRDVAMQKKTEILNNARKKILSSLKKHIDHYKDECNKVEQAILRVSEPDSPNDPNKTTLQFLKFQEVRNLIRATEPKLREQMVAGNILYIQALINAPDEIISKSTLNRLRRDYAFKIDPTLRDQEADQELIYKTVRRRCAEINATASKILINNNIDDPTNPKDHFSTFPPESEHEQVYADNRIREFDRREEARARQKEFDEKESEGIEEKAEKIERGKRKEIPH